MVRATRSSALSRPVRCALGLAGGGTRFASERRGGGVGIVGVVGRGSVDAGVGPDGGRAEGSREVGSSSLTVLGAGLEYFVLPMDSDFVLGAVAAAEVVGFAARPMDFDLMRLGPPKDSGTS